MKTKEIYSILRADGLSCAELHDTYNKGDKVSRNGEHRIPDINANVYEPGVYGWNKVQ